MKIRRWFRAACAMVLSWCCLPVTAAPAASAAAASMPTLTLSASAQMEVTLDHLAVVLKATREGSEAAAVQAQLKQALDGSLQLASRGQRPGEVDVHTGAFQLVPRFAKPGTIAGWVGSAELVVEGSDLPAVAHVAGSVTAMTIDRLAYSLSAPRRDAAADQATELAIARFRSQAAACAAAFGYAGYVLHDVDVSAGDGASSPPRSMAMAARASFAAPDAPLPVEAGNATVSASVRGSVELMR